MRDLHERLRGEVAKVVVGQDDAVEALVVALALGGHALLEGVPGVAKTLLANTVARGVLGQHLGLVLRRRVAERDPHHEAVELRLWERVGPLVLDRVLRRDD